MNEVKLGFRVCSVVVDEDNILLVKKKSMGKEYWSLPGGGIKAGESVTQAIAREVSEETGFDVAIEKFLYVRIAQDNLARFKYLELCFLTRPFGGKLEYDDEDTIEAKWVPIDAIQPLDFRPEQLKEILVRDFKESFAKNPKDLGFDEF